MTATILNPWSQAPDTFDPDDLPITDLRALEYWGIVRNDVSSYFTMVSNDQVYGDANCKNLRVFMLYHQLQLFLEFIHMERVMNANDDVGADDLGNLFYIDKYCIVAIRKALICRGFNKKLIHAIFSLYELVSTVETEDKDGIGYMGIEAVSGNIFRIF